MLITQAPTNTPVVPAATGPAAPATAPTPTPAAPRNRDKSAWPAFAPLPADLPAAATTHPAKFFVGTRFTSGSYADGPTGDSLRMSPDPLDGEASNASYLAGHDPRAALAAAAKLASGTFLPPSHEGSPRAPESTLVGVFQSRSGAMLLAPLWYSPGTNDMTHYYGVTMGRDATPDARFRFSDPALAAVVGQDGWIANPELAAKFA